MNTTQAEEIINLKEEIFLLTQSIETSKVENIKNIHELTMEYTKEKVNLIKENNFLYKQTRLFVKNCACFRIKSLFMRNCLNSNKNVLFLHWNAEYKSLLFNTRFSSSTY